MTIFLENIWIWIGLAFVVGVIGYGVFLNDRRIQTLGYTSAGVIAVLVVGLSLYCFVDTDYKSISRMLRKLADAIEADDTENVLKFIKTDAKKTRGLARSNMALVRITDARFKDLKVEVNDLTSPPIAKVSFLAVVYWQTKSGAAQMLEGFSIDRPIVEFVKFDVELEKTNDNSWLVTDDCTFTPRATP